MKTRYNRILLIAFLSLVYASLCFADTLDVSVSPNPFEQGSATTFRINLPPNEAVKRLTIDFYSQGNFLFQVSPSISSPTTLYMWNGCYPDNSKCLPPGTYSYVVKASCGCGGGGKTYEATGTVTIKSSTGCYGSESECKSNNASRCSCANAVQCQYDSTDKCYKFSSCDNSKCGPVSSEKMAISSFVQSVASGGAINYAAIAECPSEGPTAFPEEGKKGYWCKVINVGAPGQEGAIRYWALLKNDPNNDFDNDSIEIYIFYAMAACQNPPQASRVGCTDCVLFLHNMLVVQEIPKIVADGAIETLRAYQGGVSPTPSPTPQPSPGATMTLGQFLQKIYGCNLPGNIDAVMPRWGCDHLSLGEWTNPLLRPDVICYTTSYGDAHWQILLQIDGTVNGVSCSKNINNIALAACMGFKKKVGSGSWQNVTEIPAEVGNDAVSKLKSYCQAPPGGQTPTPSIPPGTSPKPTATVTPAPTVSQPPMPSGIQVTASPNPCQKGSSVTFTVTTSQSYKTLYVRIYSSDGKNILNATTTAANYTTTFYHTWDGRDSSGNIVPPGTYKCLIKACGSSCSNEATYYVVFAEQAQPPGQTPGTPPGTPGQPPSQSPGQSPTPSIPPGTQCKTNADCVCGDGCYNGNCLHPEITINGSANTLLAYTGKPLETTIVWTLTNVGDDAAVLKDVTPTGCQNLTCKLELQAGTTVKLAQTEKTSKGVTEKPKELVIKFQDSDFSVTVSPNPFEQGKTTTFSVSSRSGITISQMSVTIFDLTGSIVFESGWVNGTSYTWDGRSKTGNQLAVDAYIYTVYVKVGSEQKKADQNFVYIIKATSGADSFKFDYGELELGLDWKSVKLSKSFTKPIVVAKPIESCTGEGKTQCDKVVVRIRNIQSNSFEIRLQKWGQNASTPLTRTYKVDYLVVEEGHYDNVGGLEIEAGRFITNHVGKLVAFKKNFSNTPVLLTSIVTFNDPEPAVTRNFNPCKDWTQYYPGRWAICGEADFITKIQEYKNRNLFNLGHGNEEIHYIAISQGKATVDETQWEVRWIHSVNDEGVTIWFETDFPETPVVVADVQTVNEDEAIMLRFYKKERDSIHFFVAEEDSVSGSSWWAHKPEEVGYVAIAKAGATGLRAVIETDKDGCTCPPCTISFDGSKSTGNIVAYDWNFGDGGTATGAKVLHTYEKEGTFEAKLTVKDASGKTASTTKTITVSSCVQPIKGTVIEPGKSIKIIQRIYGLNPGKYEFDLHVKYTDLFGVSNKEASEWKKTMVEVAKLGSEKFHIKLLGEEQNFCIGPNGLFGITGKAAVPRIKLSWSFTGSGAIKIDECDDKTDFIYCDPTQFSIELAQKLNKIYELSKSRSYAEIKSLTSFKAHLIGDSYSENFQKDFVKAYSQGFLVAPSWFISGSTPWAKYFENPEALSFEPREIESGLYNVTIDMNFKGEEWQFFKEGQPNATIKVRFEKLSDATIDAQELPFYYMPFNGLVGSSGRSDYGIGFTNTKGPITIAVVGSEKIDTSISGGKKHFTATLYKEIPEILEAQGKVMKIDLGGKKIEFYTSQAMPAILGIKSTSGKAEGFYQIYSREKALGTGLDGVAYWTGIATSPDLNCSDFYGYELPFKKKDMPASSLSNTCAERSNNMPAFGFQWTNVPDNKSIFLATVFYTPPGQKMSIANACTSNACLLASKSGISKGVENPLSLDSELMVEKINDVMSLIENEYICVVPEQASVHASQNSYLFFWNEHKLAEQLSSAKQMLASEWKFNWANYECK